MYGTVYGLYQFYKNIKALIVTGILGTLYDVLMIEKGEKGWGFQVKEAFLWNS